MTDEDVRTQATSTVLDLDDLLNRLRKARSELPKGLARKDLNDRLVTQIEQMDDTVEQIRDQVIRTHLDEKLVEELRSRIAEQDDEESISLDQFMLDAGIT